MGGDLKASSQGMSRRDFAKDAALALATVAVTPTAILAQTAGPVNTNKPSAPPEEQGLSAGAKAEAEASYKALLGKYGDRLDDAQRRDVRRLVLQQQKSIEMVRSYRLDNSDAPATVLHLEMPEKA